MTIIMSVTIGALLSGAIQFALNYRENLLKSKSIEAAFCGEIKTLIFLIKKRKYIEILENTRNVIKKLKESKGINNAIFEPFLIIHSDKFWNIYLKNSENIGLVRFNVVPDIIKFYNIIFGLLEDAQHAGENVKRITEHFELDEVSLYQERLLRMDHIYSEDAELLKEAVRIGEKICSSLTKERCSFCL